MQLQCDRLRAGYGFSIAVCCICCDLEAVKSLASWVLPPIVSCPHTCVGRVVPAVNGPGQWYYFPCNEIWGGGVLPLFI